MQRWNALAVTCGVAALVLTALPVPGLRAQEAAAPAEPLIAIDPATLAASADTLAGTQPAALPVITGRPATPQPQQGGKVIQLPGPAADAAPQGLAIIKPGAGPATQPGTPATGIQPTPHAAVQSLAFTPDPGLRAALREGLDAAFPPGTPTLQMTALQTALTTGGFDDGIRAYLAAYDLSPDNAADAIAVYLATAWMAVNGGTTDPSRTQMRALRDQLALTLQTGGLDRAPDAEKQRLAEVGLATAALIGKGAAEAAADPSLAEATRTEAARLVREAFGLDLTTLQLTDQGLR